MGSHLTAMQRSQIAEALTLSRFLISQSEGVEPALIERRRDRIREIQTALQACAHPINQTPEAASEIPLPVRQAFVESALLISRYFAVGGSGWRGTLPSNTLSRYRPDPVPAHWTTPEGIAAMGRQFALPDAVMDAIVAHLAQVDAEIAHQHLLIESVLQTVGLSLETVLPLTTEPFVSLFQELFGGILVNPDRLNVVFTPTQLYFCVDFPTLEDFAGWRDLCPKEHENSLRQLHQRLSEFTFQKFQRFPTFGPCHPAGIREAWARAVSDRYNVQSGSPIPITPEQVIHRLAKSVGVLPQKDAEMFLVHDIWGHYWQLLFSQFNSDYTALADCGEALRAHETAYTPAGPLTCRELFEFAGPLVSVNEAKAVQFFHGEVRQRLGLLFTHLLGELVADIAEFKFTFTNPQAAHQLPSSSAFTDYPANLDLSLADLDFLFLRVLQPLLEIHLSPIEASPLEIELLSDSPLMDVGADQIPRLEVNLKKAIAQLHYCFLQEYGRHYLPTVESEDSLFAEIAINLLHLQNVINTLYTDPQFTEQSPLPFQDLLIVFISRFCSGDSYAEFWQVDNVLADHFIPCWHLLRQVSAER
ncbi:hypothetical protein [Leptolyngbya iicbica]|uniref:Uncharacterized protein n=2 Tax=Cyanophyceae TaxID=3028117 RepID=A0A4Q7E6L5_9CYAN|nr:hypothetical protein [Leptolyngbya sp. LK]RZM77853.1 hypothetical protein DYY88_14890 [Leptolyngbya sp. LK]